MFDVIFCTGDSDMYIRIDDLPDVSHFDYRNALVGATYDITISRVVRYD